METNNEEIWFKTKGLEIAKEICKPYNSHCKEVSETIVKEANKIGIDCKIVEPLVMHGDDLNNNHYAIQYKNILIDYCLQQFLGDNKTVDYYTLWQSKSLTFELFSQKLGFFIFCWSLFYFLKSLWL